MRALIFSTQSTRTSPPERYSPLQCAAGVLLSAARSARNELPGDEGLQARGILHEVFEQPTHIRVVPLDHSFSFTLDIMAGLPLKI